jgi:hypothetical protein
MSAIIATADSLHPEQRLQMARQARLVERVMGRHQSTRERLRWTGKGIEISMGPEEEDELDEWPVKKLIGPDVVIKVKPKPDGKTCLSPKLPRPKMANPDEEDEDGEQELRPLIPMQVGQPFPFQASANSLPPEVRETLAAKAAFIGQFVERYRTNGRFVERGPDRAGDGLLDAGDYAPPKGLPAKAAIEPRGKNKPAKDWPRRAGEQFHGTRGLAEAAIDRLNQLNEERPDLSQAERARLAWLSTFPATIGRYAPVGRHLERAAFRR